MVLVGLITPAILGELDIQHPAPGPASHNFIGATEFQRADQLARKRSVSGARGWCWRQARRSDGVRSAPAVIGQRRGVFLAGC